MTENELDRLESLLALRKDLKKVVDPGNTMFIYFSILHPGVSGGLSCNELSRDQHIMNSLKEVFKQRLITVEKELLSYKKEISGVEF